MNHPPTGIFDKRAGVSIRTLVCVGGWVLASVLIVYVAPHAYKRAVVRIPALERTEWNKRLEAKREQIRRVSWADTRPLHVFFGDSQVELGNWYDLSAGALAIRNCGLSSAKIEDVATLIPVLPDQDPASVILMCGINNLGALEPAKECADQYDALLTQTTAKFPRSRILVISVMPIRESIADARARQVNQLVAEFNQLLQPLAQRHRAVFVNLGSAVTGGRGGLSDGLTFDGLHLNARGYQVVSEVIFREAASRRGEP